ILVDAYRKDDRLLEEDAHACAQFVRIDGCRENGTSVQQNVARGAQAGIEFDQPVQGAQQRALARSGRTGQPEHPVGRDAEVDDAQQAAVDSIDMQVASLEDGFIAGYSHGVPPRAYAGARAARRASGSSPTPAAPARRPTPWRPPPDRTNP